jgi:hypothetical protein
LRPAGQAERRLGECEKLGLAEAIAAEGTATRGTIRVTQAQTLRQAISAGLDADGSSEG